MEKEYNPKDDVNVLAVIEAKEEKKLINVRTYPNVYIETPQRLDHSGYVVDITKNGFMLLSFHYIDTKLEDVVYYKKTIKFEDVDSIEIDAIPYTDAFLQKVNTYLDFVSTNGLTNHSNINLESFSSSKYSEYIVSENNLITFNESLSNDNIDFDKEIDMGDNNQMNTAISDQLNIVKQYVNNPEVKSQCATYIDDSTGIAYCSCTKPIEREVLRDNMEMFEDVSYGVCKNCWSQIINVLQKEGILNG